MAWNGSGGAADAPRSGESRRAAGCGAKPRPVPSARAKGPLRGALAALAVVLGAGLAWWLVSRPVSTEPAPEPAHGKPAAVPKPVAPKPAKADATNAQAKAEKAAKPEPPPFQKRPGAMQLPDGRVLTFRPPKEGEFRIVHSHGSTYKCDHLGNWEDVTPKPVFDNSFEEALVGMATTVNFIPGMLLGLDEKEAIRMLTKPVVVNEGDSEAQYRIECETRLAVERQIAERVADELRGLERRLTPETRPQVEMAWDEKNALLRSMGLMTCPMPEPDGGHAERPGL